LGKEHDGVKTIIEMVHGTRLDSAIGSAGLIRQGLMQVNHFSSGKKGAKFTEIDFIQDKVARILSSGNSSFSSKLILSTLTIISREISFSFYAFSMLGYLACSSS
jgi:hypothetical protein